MGEVQVGYKVGWHPDFAIWNMVHLVVSFTVKGVSSGNAVDLFDGGKEATFGNLSIMAAYM
jgi:hypothetical protein